MGIVIFALLVLVVVALVLWAINEVPGIDGTVRALLRVLVIVIGALAIASKGGLLP